VEMSDDVMCCGETREREKKEERVHSFPTLVVYVGSEQSPYAVFRGIKVSEETTKRMQLISLPARAEPL
jgi:hypothetical protein